MTQLDLYKEFYGLENEYRPLMDELTKNQEEYKYEWYNDKEEKTGYKGWVWLQSKLIYQPDILFIGYNPGQSKGGEKDFYFPLTGERQFACFEDNNAYYNYPRELATGQPTRWYERNQPQNNDFYVHFLDIIWRCAVELYSNGCIPKKSKVPQWFKTVEEKVSFINLYPMATEKIGILEGLLKKIYEKHPEIILGLYDEKPREEKKKQPILTDYEIKFPFIYRVQKIQQWMKPKLTVCIGTKTFREFTCCTGNFKPDDNGLLIPSPDDISKDIIPNIIGFTRIPWPIKAAVNEIVNRLCPKNP